MDRKNWKQDIAIDGVKGMVDLPGLDVGLEKYRTVTSRIEGSGKQLDDVSNLAREKGREGDTLRALDIARKLIRDVASQVGENLNEERDGERLCGWIEAFLDSHGEDVSVLTAIGLESEAVRTIKNAAQMWIGQDQNVDLQKIASSVLVRLGTE